MKTQTYSAGHTERIGVNGNRGFIQLSYDPTWPKWAAVAFQHGRKTTWHDTREKALAVFNEIKPTDPGFENTPESKLIAVSFEEMTGSD